MHPRMRRSIIALVGGFLSAISLGLVPPLSAYAQGLIICIFCWTLGSAAIISTVLACTADKVPSRAVSSPLPGGVA